METPAKQQLDKKTALAKAEHYCAYQERSQQEVRDKLYSYGLHSADVEELISELIQANFLNEERFARAYVLGKFRIKHWGRQKLKQGLKIKRVSDNLIKKALTQIGDEEYEQSLRLLIEKKDSLLKEKDPFKRKQKLMQHALSKGYESEMILDCLNSSGLFKN